MPLRDEFPPPGSDYLGGYSDGWEYRTLFSGSSLQASYEMVRQFLREEGYASVPVPADVDELLLFKHPRQQSQFVLFAEPGYVHNPLRILFHPYRNRHKTLILCLYNENDPQHLLKFHGVLPALEVSGEKG